MTADPMSSPPTQDDLAAGKALDALIAEKVMGWRNWTGSNHSGLIGGTWSPSTSIDAAWQIVEWAEASPRGWKLTLMRSGRSLPDYVWICTFHRGHVELARVVEREAPVAICKAALQAVSA